MTKVLTQLSALEKLVHSRSEQIGQSIAVIGSNNPQPSLQRIENTLTESLRIISGISVEVKQMFEHMQNSVSSFQSISTTTQTQEGSYPDLVYEANTWPTLDAYCRKIEVWEHNVSRLGLDDISLLSGLASLNMGELKAEAESYVRYLERYRNS